MMDELICDLQGRIEMNEAGNPRFYQAASMPESIHMNSFNSFRAALPSSNKWLQFDGQIENFALPDGDLMNKRRRLKNA
jgi:hypothetical protein